MVAKTVAHMKRIFLAISAMLLMVTVGYCQETKQPLQLTIKSDKKVYEVGEEINITASIRNKGKDIAKIYSPDYWGVSEIFVINSQGVPMIPGGLKIRRRAFDAFMTIPPDESRVHTFENFLWFHCGGGWQFIDDAQLKPDTYKIYVTVTNPPADKCSGDKKFEKTDLSGTLTSNTITIMVKEKNEAADYSASEVMRNAAKKPANNVNLSPEMNELIQLIHKNILTSRKDYKWLENYGEDCLIADNGLFYIYYNHDKGKPQGAQPRPPNDFMISFRPLDFEVVTDSHKAKKPSNDLENVNECKFPVWNAELFGKFFIRDAGKDKIMARIEKIVIKNCATVKNKVKQRGP